MIPIISTIVPQNDGVFPTHASQYGLGGWHEVDSIEERDAIPRDRRKAGMACSVAQDSVYILGFDLATWTEVVFNGIGDAPIDGKQYVRQNGQWVTAVTDDGIYA